MTIEGVEWTLSAATDLGVPLGDVEVTAMFDGGRIAGRGGCNRYTGSYALDGASLTISPGVVMTMMACPEPQMAVERAYLARLGEVTVFAAVLNTLTLRDATGGTVLVFERIAPERALAGEWTVTALRTADSVSSPLAGPELTIAFAGDRVSGSTGCNRFNGRFAADGQRLDLDPPATTRRACLDAAHARQELDYLAALAATASYSATRSTVTLFAVDGTTRVELTRG